MNCGRCWPRRWARDVDLLQDYGRPAREVARPQQPARLVLPADPPLRSPRPTNPRWRSSIAAGVITDGEGGDGFAARLRRRLPKQCRKAFRTAARDPNVKAVVIRIDSPGGSALASEVMWQAARHCRREEAGHRERRRHGGERRVLPRQRRETRSMPIPVAIVGSIGVVGGNSSSRTCSTSSASIPKHSQGTECRPIQHERAVERSSAADGHQLDEADLRAVHQRVMTTRGQDQGHRQGRPRPHLHGQAGQDLGMVDELGGVEDALAYAAHKGGPRRMGTYVADSPAPRLSATSSWAAAPKQPPRSDARDRNQRSDGCRLSAPLLKKGLGGRLQMLELLQNRPVVLVAPFEVAIK